MLSMLVVASHLIGTPSAAFLGDYAVRGFFILSGFVISKALNEVYDFRFLPFWINRTLRIMPTYLVVCAASLAAILLWPAATAAFHSHWAGAISAKSLTENLIILPLAFDGMKLRLFEPGWSLAVELMMYFMLWLTIARGRLFALFGLAAGALYHMRAVMNGVSFEVRYFAPESALLAFSIGATIYFLLRDYERPNQNRYAAMFAGTAIVFWMLNLWSATDIDSITSAQMGNYYLNTALSALIVCGLALLSGSKRLRKIDTWLGSLSYHVFLLQWLGGFAAHQLLMPTQFRGIGIFVASLLFILP
ncbi:MAG: acyltransferase, partial [Proteobacteria bacterium]|nr:acyltransferase [Pseudomonadota bacterium]